MSTPSLPETLIVLSRLLPERVRANSNGEEVRVRWGVIEKRPFMEPDLIGRPRWRCLFEHWGDAQGGWVAMHDMPEQWLEAALREECEERAWWWQVQCYDGAQWLAQVSPVRDEPGGRISTDSPAHALALAMISALGGETTP